MSAKAMLIPMFVPRDEFHDVFLNSNVLLYQWLLTGSYIVQFLVGFKLKDVNFTYRFGWDQISVTVTIQVFVRVVLVVIFYQVRVYR